VRAALEELIRLWFGKLITKVREQASCCKYLQFLIVFCGFLITGMSAVAEVWSLILTEPVPSRLCVVAHSNTVYRMTTLVAFVASHLMRIRLSLNELLSLSRSFTNIKLSNDIVCTVVRVGYFCRGACIRSGVNGNAANDGRSERN